MSVTTDLTPPTSQRSFPEPKAVLTLLKPITWFPPMWAYLCGAVSAGVSPSGQWLAVILGVILAGPIVCGMSQAANDWCDRHVDAINEPHRPIPSGRIPGRWGLWIALIMSAFAAVVGLALVGHGCERDAGRRSCSSGRAHISVEPIRPQAVGLGGGLASSVSS